MHSRKIGTITFHCSYNYGSVLQAYALQQYLIGKGYETKVINYYQRDNFEAYRIFRLKSYKKRPILIAADLFYFLPQLRCKKAFNNFSKKYLILTEKKYTDLSDLSDLNQQFDTFICGSDQIWNLDCTHGIVPAYYLEFVKRGLKKIAYGPSLSRNAFSPENVDEKRLAIDLNSFHAISLREKSTIPFYQAYTSIPISCVLDPVMLLNESCYRELAADPREKEYIFLYMLEKYDDRLIRYCNELYKQYNLKTIYISKKRYTALKNGKKIYGCSPEAFLGYIKNASFIVTNSFHATVFSVIFRKKFHTFTTQKSYARMQDYLKELGIEDRLYERGLLIDSEIDYDLVFSKLKTLKDDSEKFLLSALEE